MLGFAIMAAASAATGRRSVPGYYAISGLALLQLVGMMWRGTTPGKVVFELEVVDVATGRAPRPRAALARTLVLYAGMLVVGWGEHFVTLPNWVGFVLYLLTYGLPLFALVRASLRVAGKRTPWDRIAGTIVHYKSARQLATS
jgi:RDD family